MLKDKYKRIINYARISLTDRCPLECRYCRTGIKLNQSEILSYEEIIEIIKVLKSLGFNKFRFTGGEPLFRKNVLYFFQNLPENLNYHLTTSLSVKNFEIEKLNRINFKSINIKLDTIDQLKYKYITRNGDFEIFLDNLNRLKCQKIKFNSVIIKNFNEDEIINLIEFALKYNADIRFIEKMSLYNDELQFLSLSNIKKKLLKEKIIIDEPEIEENSTAAYYPHKDKSIKIGFITPVSSPFCNRCNRLRIKANGDIKLCIFDNSKFNLKELFKKGLTSEELKNFISSIILEKPKSMMILTKEESMAEIGG